MTYIEHRSLSYIAFCAIIAAISSSCGKGDTLSNNSADYYMDALGWTGGGVVYIYEPVDDPSRPEEVWHYRMLPDYRGNYIRSARYDLSGEIVQRSVEHIGRDKAILTSMDLRFVLPDTIIEAEPRVLKNEAFTFGDINQPLESIMKIDYWDTTGDSVRVILTRRRVIDRVGTYPFEGEERPAIFVKTTEVLETETEGFTETVWNGIEIYVQNVGMVYYKKEISELMELEYRLKERISFEQFNLESMTTETNG